MEHTPLPTSQPEPNPTSTPPEKGKPPKKAPPQPISRQRKFFRWLLVLLIFFGLGALLVLQLLYVPLRSANVNLQANLRTAQAQFTTLQEQADGLENASQSTRQAMGSLEEQLQETNLHNALLRARLDIARAQYFMALESPTNARAALSSTRQTLGAMGELFKPEDQKVIQNLQDRLDLVLTEIDSTPDVAAADLEVLSSSLMELENVYFANPAGQLQSTPRPTTTP